jgi:hypothetical protein
LINSKVIRTAGAELAIGIGIYAAYLGGMHGYYEISNGSRNPQALLFDAVSGKPLTADFPGWPGWPALSIVQESGRKIVNDLFDCAAVKTPSRMVDATYFPGEEK